MLLQDVIAADQARVFFQPGDFLVTVRLNGVDCQVLLADLETERYGNERQALAVVRKRLLSRAASLPFTPFPGMEISMDDQMWSVGDDIQDDGLVIGFTMERLAS